MNNNNNDTANKKEDDGYKSTALFLSGVVVGLIAALALGGGRRV